MLPLNDARSGHFDGAVALCLDGTLAVDGLTQRVDNAADEVFAHGNGNYFAGALDGVAFLNAAVRAQNDNGNRVLFQILGHTESAVGEFHQFACHALVQTGDLGNAVTHQNDHTGLAGLNFIFVIFDLRTNDLRDFFRS